MRPSTRPRGPLPVAVPSHCRRAHQGPGRLRRPHPRTQRRGRPLKGRPRRSTVRLAATRRTTREVPCRRSVPQPKPCLAQVAPSSEISGQLCRYMHRPVMRQCSIWMRFVPRCPIVWRHHDRCGRQVAPPRDTERRSGPPREDRRRVRARMPALDLAADLTSQGGTCRQSGTTERQPDLTERHSQGALRIGRQAKHRSTGPQMGEGGTRWRGGPGGAYAAHQVRQRNPVLAGRRRHGGRQSFGRRIPGDTDLRHGHEPLIDVDLNSGHGSSLPGTRSKRPRRPGHGAAGASCSCRTRSAATGWAAGRHSRCPASPRASA